MNEAWIKCIADGEGKDFIQIQDKINENSVICSRHFSEQMYLSLTTQKRLKKNAIPSIFGSFENVSCLTHGAQFYSTMHNSNESM